MSTYNTYAESQQHTSKSIGTSISKAGNISYWTAVGFLILIAALHFIKPEFAPSWRFLSEYAIGENGWVMQLAFLFLSASCFGCFFALRSQKMGRGGKIGLWLLLAVAVSIIAASIFVMDPVTATPNELTAHGNLHGMSSMIGVPGLSIAAMLISFSLARKNQAWSSSKSSIKLAAVFCLISFIVLVATVIIGLGKTGGKFGPEVYAGLANRLLVISWCVWLMLISKKITQINTGLVK